MPTGQKVVSPPELEANSSVGRGEVPFEEIVIADVRLALGLGGDDGICTCVCISDCTCDPSCILQ